MGQQQSNIKDEIKNKYTIIKTIAPGEYLVKGRRKGEELQLRILSFLVEDEMTQYINLLEKRKKIKNPHLLELIQYNKVIDQLMCSSTFKLKIISELPFKSIKDDIRERSTSVPKKYFAEDELWSILYSCCHALYSLYINKFSHESLTTGQIYIDTQGIIKVADSLLVHGTKNYLSLMNEDVKLEDIRYISPELRNLVDDNNFYQYQKEKSDVYILGMIILQISSLSPLKYFDPKNKRFHFEIIQTIFTQFKERYSPKLYEIVNKMLTSDYNIRPSFEDIIENIQQKTFHTNSNISSKDSTIINEAHKQYLQKSSKPPVTLGNTFAPTDLNQVKQKLNFDFKPSNTAITQPSQSVNFNHHIIYQPKNTISNYSSLPAPPLFTNFVNPQPQIKTNNYQLPPPKLTNNFNWKFDTVSKEPKRQNQHNYTPYQQLMNLSGNASIPNSHIPAAKQQNFMFNQPNGLTANISTLKNPKIPEFNQENFMKERRFSESKFGGIQIGYVPNAQATQKKQLKAPQKFSSFTESKPLSTISNKLFKKQKQEQQLIIEKGTFVIQQNASGRYQGFKQNNQKNGIGRITYTDGGSYQGQWKNDRMDGYGKLFYPNGKTAYEGYWIQDEFNGTGRVYNEIQENSSRKKPVNYLDFSDIEDKWQYYQGEFNHDLRQGKGMIKFITGEKFYGTFQQDVIQGEGSFHKNDGDAIQGTWKNNVFVNA